MLNYFTTLGTETADCTAASAPTTPSRSDSGCDPRGAWDAADLARQQTKIVTAINALDAAVIGLMEIENSASLVEAWPMRRPTTLVLALNAAAGEERWAFVPSST